MKSVNSPVIGGRAKARCLIGFVSEADPAVLEEAVEADAEEVWVSREVIYGNGPGGGEIGCIRCRLRSVYSP